LRVPALRATLCSLIALCLLGAAVPVPALAGKAVSGGTAASSAATSSSTTPLGTTTAGGTTTSSSPSGAAQTQTKTKTAHAPVTARTSRLAYRGPVYERTATGQVVPYVAPASAAQINASTGGSLAELATVTKPQLLVPGVTARYVDGLAAAPMSAPPAVQEIIWAGNQLIGLPYIYGGGHASFVSPGYDCSGTVSYALHGAALLSAPEDSSEFMGFGAAGVGRWVTIFTNPGHAYMTVAGLRLDTSAADDPSNEQGPRWRPLRPGNGGYTIRHPVGF
jgi:cell wall-associated NlpC family hydrolase